MNILLVEDDPGDVRLMREAFETTEAETTLRVVTTGEDALECLRRQGEYEQAPFPDMVLLDLDLPGKSGCELLETIREDAKLRCLPVIVLTISDANEDIAKCYAAGANAYLTKPTDPDDFSDVVAAVESFWIKRAQLPPIPE